MHKEQRITAAEAQVLESLLPDGLTEQMREVALLLFESLAQQEGFAGAQHPCQQWRAQLMRLARVALAQLQHLASHVGGSAIYMAKGIAVHLSARDRAMCEKFRGNNYFALAREYGLTEMRVRQIVGAWQQEQFLRRQGQLPGLDEPSIS